jgi:tyrosine-specific transport protein
MPPRQQASVLGQALLVTGSAVGAGLLALPAVTWKAGFWASVVGLSGTWAYMSATGALLVEAAALEPSGGKVNLLGMARYTLGDWGGRVCFVLYLSIYAATLTAYLAEGGRQAVELLGIALHCAANSWDACVDSSPPPQPWAVTIGQMGFAVGFSAVIFRGPGPVERLNTICMGAAMLAFAALVYAAAAAASAAAATSSSTQPLPADPGPEPEPVGPVSDWGALRGALPVMIVAFSYHNTVPSVFSSLGGQPRQAAAALILGSSFALVMYVVWQAVVLGGGGPPVQGGSAPSKEQIFASLRSAILRKCSGVHAASSSRTDCKPSVQCPLLDPLKVRTHQWLVWRR